MNNIEPTLDETVAAMATLRKAGWLLTQSIYGGTNATHPGRQKRHDGQTAANLIELASKEQPKPEADHAA